MATVGEKGLFYVSNGNLSTNAQKVKCGTMLGTPAPVRLVHHEVPQCARAHTELGDEKSKFCQQGLFSNRSELPVKVFVVIGVRVSVLYRSIGGGVVRARGQEAH